jgi:hypothetical protein
MERKENIEEEKIVRFPSKGFRFEIIILIVLMIFLCFQFINYLRRSGDGVYEVRKGLIQQNNHYNALAIRSEQIIKSDSDGYPFYYQKDKSQIGMDSVIYALDTDGTISQSIAKSNSDFKSIPAEDRKNITDSLSSFVNSYDPYQFQKTYEFMSNLNETVSESIIVSKIQKLSETDSGKTDKSLKKYYPQSTGVVSYIVDGGEGLTIDNFNSQSMNEGTYKRKDLRTTSKLEEGSDVYKLITDTNWHLVIQIPDNLSKRLDAVTSKKINVKFDDDQSEESADYSISERDGNKFLILSLDHGVERYADERFVSIELLLDENEGLKIPVSSIVTSDKYVYIVPDEYIYQEKYKDAYYIRRLDKKKISIDIMKRSYGKTYIYSSALKSDMQIISDSGNTFILGTEKEHLEGVYNVNKGYAVFKKISVLYRNNDYAIVSDNTSDGLILYDYIALNGKSTHQNEIFNK